jgi:hypothetical protein
MRRRVGAIAVHTYIPPFFLHDLTQRAKTKKGRKNKHKNNQGKKGKKIKEKNTAMQKSPPSSIFEVAST